MPASVIRAAAKRRMSIDERVAAIQAPGAELDGKELLVRAGDLQAFVEAELSCAPAACLEPSVSGKTPDTSRTEARNWNQSGSGFGLLFVACSCGDRSGSAAANGSLRA